MHYSRETGIFPETIVIPSKSIIVFPIDDSDTLIPPEMSLSSWSLWLRCESYKHIK